MREDGGRARGERLDFQHNLSGPVSPPLKEQVILFLKFNPRDPEITEVKTKALQEELFFPVPSFRYIKLPCMFSFISSHASGHLRCTQLAADRVGAGEGAEDGPLPARSFQAGQAGQAAPSAQLASCRAGGQQEPRGLL